MKREIAFKFQRVKTPPLVILQHIHVTFRDPCILVYTEKNFLPFCLITPRFLRKKTQKNMPELKLSVFKRGTKSYKISKFEQILQIRF